MSSKRKNFERGARSKRTALTQSVREAEMLLDLLAERDEEDFVERPTDAFSDNDASAADDAEDLFPLGINAAESMGRKHLK
jgi:hypothetical protein